MHFLTSYFSRQKHDFAHWTKYTYTKNGNRESCTTPNGIVNSYTYDAQNRVLTSDSVKDGATIYSCVYGYDLVGNRLTIDEGTLDADGNYLMRNLVYTYDDRYQMTSETWENNSYAYTYDKAGNRETMTKNGVLTDYYYNERNEILSWTDDVKSCSYNYDANGNRTHKVFGPHGASTVTMRYEYDTSNRLIRAWNPAMVGDLFKATYDYRTRRISKTENGETTTFRYDGGVSYQEWKDGAVQVEFVRGSGMGGGIGSILYSDRPLDDREYFVYNAVGHTVATVTDAATLTIKSAQQYEAMGNIVFSSGASDNNRLANTKERDASLGLDNHGFRYYDPEIGRYTTRDPIGYGDGMNVYLSVHNNPINHIDPLGLCETCGNDKCKGCDKKPEPEPTVPPTGTVLSNGMVQFGTGTITKKGYADYLKRKNADKKLSPKEKAAKEKEAKEAHRQAIGEAVGPRIPLTQEEKNEKERRKRDELWGASPFGRHMGSPELTSKVSRDIRASLKEAGKEVLTDLALGAAFASIKKIKTIRMVFKNTDTVIGNRKYVGHALDRMQERGLVPMIIEDAIQHGSKTAGNQPSTFVYIKDKVRVIVNASGDVITAMKKTGGQ